ncbi:MAG: diacylglycerol kinase family protein [Candidatus Kerfeldbacteria bacterium]|nr:diacylglycerol kinase family protein [Candidatus Kerfeldbacteria bacterium]
MSLVHTHNFRKSLGYAARGLRYVYTHERNFQIHTFFAVVALALGWLLGISETQWLFILTAIASVLALEIVNTIFEKFVDMFQPRVHHYAEVIKDLMAGAVLIASGSALAVGIIIYLPLIITRLT